MSMSPTLRAKIVKAVQARINALYGPGTSSKWFREVRQGTLRPAGGKFPLCTVSDGGQTRVEDGDDDSGAERLLIVLVTLQLADTWDRVTTQETWSERVESLIGQIEAWLPSGCGVVRGSYTRDDPADIVLASGASEAAWEIEFEFHRVVDKTQSEAAE